MDMSCVLCQVRRPFLNIIRLNALYSPLPTIVNITNSWTAGPLKMGVGIGCTETSVAVNPRCVTSQKVEDLNFAEAQLLLHLYPLMHIKNLPRVSPLPFLNAPPSFKAVTEFCHLSCNKCSLFH
jgi:hypothetical protein